MGRPAGWMQKLTGRDPMRSPGAPSHRRETEHQFWRRIATGITSEKAAEAVGVPQAMGSRWFRHRGGMPLFMSKSVSGRYLSFAEREEIGILRAQDIGVREIARRIGRSPSTVSRELTRNAATRGGVLESRASVAQWKLELVARRPKPAKLVMNQRLRQYVQNRLEAKIYDAQEREVVGPRQAPFIGRNRPHRGDRKWVNVWSPEQIANRLQVEFSEDESMRISREAIYQALYIQGRGALKRELVNTAARNVVVVDNKISNKKCDFFTFNNIRGRSGRMWRHFIGHVYLFNDPPQSELEFVDVPVFTQNDSAPDALAAAAIWMGDLAYSASQASSALRMRRCRIWRECGS